MSAFTPMAPTKSIPEKSRSSGRTFSASIPLCGCPNFSWACSLAVSFLFVAKKQNLRRPSSSAVCSVSLVSSSSRTKFPILCFPPACFPPPSPPSSTAPLNNPDGPPFSPRHPSSCWATPATASTSSIRSSSRAYSIPFPTSPGPPASRFRSSLPLPLQSSPTDWSSNPPVASSAANSRACLFRPLLLSVSSVTLRLFFPPVRLRRAFPLRRHLSLRSSPTAWSNNRPAASSAADSSSRLFRPLLLSVSSVTLWLSFLLLWKLSSFHPFPRRQPLLPFAH